MAQALGHQACLNGYRTMYFITSRIFKKLKLSKVDGTYLKELEKLVKPELLILDDFGLQAFDNNDRETLMISLTTGTAKSQQSSHPRYPYRHGMKLSEEKVL